jgi:hypothetical protein
LSAAAPGISQPEYRVGVWSGPLYPTRAERDASVFNH